MGKQTPTGQKSIILLKKQLDDIKARKSKIDGFTWNNNAQSTPNNMQLVPEDIHDTLVPHTGQNSLKKGK